MAGPAVPTHLEKPVWRTGARLSDWAIAVIVFLGGFVLFEPAPYELVLAAVLPLWVFAGLRLNRFTAPLITLCALFVVGGIVAMTQVTSMAGVLLFVAVSAFLAISAIWFASIIADAPERRLPLILNAYVASAVVIALFGIAAYFEIFPGAATFKLAGRATSTFQDPNVFGPYLALPLCLMAHRILTRPLHKSAMTFVLFAILALGVLLSFSRAAWGLSVLALIVTAIIAFMTRRDDKSRARVAIYVVLLSVVSVVILALVISSPLVADLFGERARLVQYYDGGRLGRFDRILLGFATIPEHPLGLGAFEFSRELFGEDEHNTWLKGFTTYGWIGGGAYVVLALWTLIASFPLLFRDRPWQPYVHATYAAFIGHLMVHMVIDVDHWRHMFLIYGILWGAIAVEKTERWRRSQPAIPRARPHARPVAAAV